MFMVLLWLDQPEEEEVVVGVRGIHNAKMAVSLRASRRIQYSVKELESIAFIYY